MKLFLLVLKNLRRNKVRSILTALAIFLLVAIFTLIATVINFLNEQMTVQSKDVLSLISDRYRAMGNFDQKYIDDIASTGTMLNSKLSNIEGFHGENTNLWHFVALTLDPTMQDRDQFFFVIATWPEKISTMTHNLKGFDTDGKLAEFMKHPPASGTDNIGVIMGTERLKKIGKNVGDVFKAIAVSHKGGDGKPIEIEIEIVGTLPNEGRWAQVGFMDVTYLNRVLKAVGSTQENKVNLGWLMTDSQESAIQSGGIVESHVSEVKCEPLSAAIGRMLDQFKNILDGIKYILVPAIFGVMIVIIANAISITVRERRMEIAVLKVLGFGPWQIMMLVLGEGVLLGTLAGGLSSLSVWALLNHVKLPIQILAMKVPDAALAWGLAAGGITALAGSILPALSARQVKVVDVFSKVA